MTKRELPALKAQVDAELGRLRQIVEEIESLRSQIEGREPTRVEQVAAAAYLHNLYNAIENCFVRIAHGVDESVPTGADRHRLLLDQLGAEIPGLRPAVVDTALERRLDEYRRFRHAFRHMYFFDLDWPRVSPLLQGAATVASECDAALNQLFATLVH